MKFNEAVLCLAFVNQPTAHRPIFQMFVQPLRNVLMAFSSACDVVPKMLTKPIGDIYRIGHSLEEFCGQFVRSF